MHVGVPMHSKELFHDLLIQDFDILANDGTRLKISTFKVPKS